LGLRGPRAGRKPTRRAASGPRITASEAQPWELPSLPRAEKVVRFIESLPCSAGPLAGTQFKLRPWQKRFVRAVYATDKQGRRQVKTAVLSMGRGGGKTTLAACLALCHLAGPEAESRGEVYSAANDRFQASRIFNELVAIAQRVPWLEKRLSIRRYPKEIEDFETGSLFASLSADAPTKHGLSPSCVIYDELGQATSRDLLEAFTTALAKRPEPLLLVISTQAARDEAPLSTLIDYGLRIQSGEVDDPSFLLHLYTAPADADPWSPKTWKLANPALGDFLSLPNMKRMARQAKEMRSAEAAFRNLCLNQRIDTTEHFISPPVWKACGDPVDIDRLKGRPCFAGLDLGATRDLTALILCFADDDGGYDVVPYIWLPGDPSEREDQDRTFYQMWVKQGHLLTFPGRSSTDPEVVALKIAELHGRYNIRALAFDRWRIEDLQRELSAIGCSVPLVPFGQGFKDQAPAVDLLERLVFERKIRHGNHPVLTAAAANAKIEMDAAGNRKLSKRKATGRIDPLVATVMAVGVAPRQPKPIDASTLVTIL
jgi:phage terminase large subunit-like protein